MSIFRSEVRYLILYLYLHILSYPLLLCGEAIFDNSIDGFPRVIILELITFAVVYLLVWKFSSVRGLLTYKPYTYNSISYYNQKYGYIPSVMKYSVSELIRESYEQRRQYQ